MLCGVLNGSERVAEPTVTSKISNGFHKKTSVYAECSQMFHKNAFLFVCSNNFTHLYFRLDHPWYLIQLFLFFFSLQVLICSKFVRLNTVFSLAHSLD